MSKIDQNKLQKFLASLLFALLMLNQAVVAQQADSLVQAKKWHQRTAFKTLAVPVVLIGAGIYMIGERGVYSSMDARYDVQHFANGFRTSVDDFMPGLPAVAVYGLNLFGVEGKYRFFDRSVIYGMANLFTTVSVHSIKNTTRILRPDSTTYNSFPSAHTAYAFTAAEFMRMEYRHKSAWYGVAGYTVATATGVLRMINNRHWLSDVLAGAGFGILSTRVSYLVYPWV